MGSALAVLYSFDYSDFLFRQPMRLIHQRINLPVYGDDLSHDGLSFQPHGAA